MRIPDTLFLAAALLSAATLRTQSPASPPVEAPAKAVAIAAVPDVATRGDAILAAWMHSDCTNTIALAKLAIDRTEHEDVRKLAKQLVADHTALAARLQPFAAPSTPTVGKPAVIPPVTPGRNTPAEATTDRVRPAANEFDHAGLIRDLAAKCLASATASLTGKSTAEFDRCFVVMQLGAHQRDVDMLAVFAPRASPELRRVFDDGAKVLVAHHELLMALQKKVVEVAVVDPKGTR